MNSSILSSNSVKPFINPWLIKLVYHLGYWLVLPSFFGQITITGQENIPMTGPTIVAPTHRSRWDALIVPKAVGRFVSSRDVRFMVTSTEMTGIQGCLIHHLGGFPVDVQHPGLISLKHSVKLLKAGEMLVIFPEGGIFRDDEIHPLKQGVARIALKVEFEKPGSQIKILPVGIRYIKPYPNWGTDVTVTIGKAIEVTKYNPQKMKSSSKKLTDDLEVILKDLYQRQGTSESVASVS